MPNETPYSKRSVLLTGSIRWTQNHSTWRSRGTSDWLLVLTIGGTGRFGHARGGAVAEPGDATLIPPGSLHDYGKEPSADLWEILWAHFDPRPEWREWLAWPEIAPGLMRLRFPREDDRAFLRESMIEIDQLAAGARKRREALAMNALERLLLWLDERNPSEAGIDPRALRVMDHLCRHLKEPLSRERLAALSGLSVSRLSHLFREETGTSLQRFQEIQRIGHAKRLLEFSPLTVAEIAEEAGFENPFYFSLRFKRQTGMSPSLYRKSRTGASEG